MERKVEAQVALPPVSHIGFIVKNVEKAAEYYYSVLGIGPFAIQEVDMQGVTLYDEPTPFKLRIAMAVTGSVELELIQDLGGCRLYTEFLSGKGEGLHHLGVHIDDRDSFDKTVAALINQGCKPILSIIKSRFGFVYVDIKDAGGLILELMYNIHIKGGV